MSNDRQIETPAGTDLPSFTILSNGKAISEEYRIASVTVKRNINRIASATIVLFDGSPDLEDFPISNTDDFIPGQTIEIQAGYHREEELIFKGIVVKNKVSAPKGRAAMLRIECKDEAVKLSIGRKSKYYYESTDAEIIEEILSGAGLSAEVEATDTTHQEMVQYNCRDWDFLVSIAETNNRLVCTKDGTVKVSKPDLSSEPVLNLLYGGNVLDFELEMEARQQYEGVNAFAWDPAGQELIEVEGAPPSGKLPGNISTEDLSKVIGLEHFELRHAGQLQDTQLQAWADMQLLKSKLSKIRGRIRIQGTFAVQLTDMVNMKGAGERFNGNLFVSGLQHDITSGNWETHLEVGLSPEWFCETYQDINVAPSHGILPSINGLQIGLVTALEGDPEGDDRIQVRIPMIAADEEGIWARLTSFDAGENRGAVFRPEVGDEVILGFLDDDPRNAVVLGGVHSSAKPAPIPASDDNHEKGFVSRSELKLLFNDEVKSIQIETPNGNKVILTEEEGGILIEDENGNKILTSSDGINIESAKDIILKAAGDVKIEGTNIELKAQANFKAEGSGGAELSSSATATIKGSMVQIN